MKKIFTTLLLFVALMTATTANAQVKFGLKGGLNVTNMSFSSEVIDKDNQTGFFVGPTLKFTIPVVGLGVDVAALYDQRDAKIVGDDNSETISQKSINVPINVRYNIGLGSLAGIYVAAGPQFGFNVGDKSFGDLTDGSNYKLKDSNFSVNLGAGVSLLSHLEIGFAYNIAIGKTGDVTVKDAAGETLSTNSRNNAWQVSAAYYF